MFFLVVTFAFVIAVVDETLYFVTMYFIVVVVVV
jgi:hypothetical protein